MVTTQWRYARTAHTDKATGRYFFFIAACAQVYTGAQDPDRRRAAGVLRRHGLARRELIAAGLGTKTGQRMGHISMSGDNGAIAALAGLGIARKIFLHINNSNHALLPDSAERKAIEEAGWQIPADGTEVIL